MLYAGSDATRKLLWLVAGAALIAGTWARFKGLGTWPLSWDEYYLAQSVQFVLHSGLPEYPCGGFYSRGVLVQYVAALLQMIGLSAEVAPRCIAAVSSLLALPAAFRIARRCGGVNVALMTVAILALSVWEVEIGRFGRMYAPFQAVFLWYVVFFLDYTVEQKARALVPMLILSATGVLVWEGGALLALANFLPPLIRQSVGKEQSDGTLTRGELAYLLLAGALFVPLYWFATADLRVMGTAPTLPPGYESMDEPARSPLDLVLPPFHFLAAHAAWLGAALLPLAAVSLGLRWLLLHWRARPLTLAGLAACLGAAMLHQFLLCAAGIVLLLVLRLIDLRTLASRSGPYLLALAACLAFWTAFGLSIPDWHPPGTTAHAAFLLLYEFARFPDLIRQILVPWAHSLPTLGVVLALLIGAEVARTVSCGRSVSETERAVLIVLITLLVAASAADTPRHETRYVFFLYPLALIIALTGISHALQLLLKQPRIAAAGAALVCLGGFAFTEDFRPGHLLHIDSAEVSFRQGMSSAEAAQYPARSDLSGAASWLQAHVTPGTDLVINGFPGVDFYYPHASYFFMENTDSRFESWSCRAGTLERWSNLPLIHSVAMLDARAASHPRVWLVIESARRADVLKRLVEADPAWQYDVAWIGRNPGISIVSLTRSKDPA
ncbi:MAG: ArnT family glycosyltransferase [Steroidobacteraceae bacterium]